MNSNNNTVEVQVGDKIYLKKWGKLYAVEEVIRVTNTIIRTANHNYRKPKPGETSNYLEMPGGDIWRRTEARLETPDLKKEWHQTKLKNWIEKNWNNIPFEQIEMLKDTLGEGEE